MKCPKCGNEQAGTVECAACGIVFEKYRRHQEARARKAAQPVAPSPPPARTGLYLAVGGGVALGVLLLGFIFFGAKERPLATVAAPAPRPAQEQPVAPVAMPAAAQVAAAPASGIDGQLAAKVPAGNPVERARNATVFIKTSWGVGSGFFINEGCTIVTNKHVVTLGAAKVAEVEGQLQQWKEEARKIKSVIEANRKTYDEALARNRAAASDPRARYIEEKITSDEQRLAEFEQKIRTEEEEFNNRRMSTELKVVLADGTELDGRIDQVSDDYDLAVVGLVGGDRCPAIPLGDVEALRQGDKLFTVGSPMGIRHSVTSGIYSGAVELDGKTMLQTDASINPGNSGGPLLNEAGQVVGINTMVMNRAQGIGFAIPIWQVRQALNVSP